MLVDLCVLCFDRLQRVHFSSCFECELRVCVAGTFFREGREKERVEGSFFMIISPITNLSLHWMSCCRIVTVV